MAATLPPHPGKIRVLDDGTGKLIRELDAAKLTDAERYVREDAGYVPVVTIRETEDGRRKSTREYGPDGRLLRAAWYEKRAPGPA